MSKTTAELDVAGKKVTVSNLEKVLYPQSGFTKGQVIDYYVRIAEVLLPHAKDKPLTLKRYPNGVAAPFFYEKNCPTPHPDWVKTGKVWSDGNDDYMHYCLLNNLPTLVWVANLASLELHVTMGKWRNIEKPTAIVFDLDPGAPATMVECCEVALLLRKMLDKMNLKAYAKTSGSKGLQIYVPLNTTVTAVKAKEFALRMAELLREAMPNGVVSDMKKTLRKGKVLVDWSQNSPSKTTVAVYSLRAKDTPSISTPVTWDEVAACGRKKQADMLFFDPEMVLKRVKKMGDLFLPVLQEKQKLPKLQ